MKFCAVFKRIAALAAALALLSVSASAFSDVDISGVIDGICRWKRGDSPTIYAALTAGDTNGDWFAKAAAELGIEGGEEYLERLEAYVRQKYSAQGGLDKVKATEWHRIAMAVSALGGDAENFGGVNLIEDGITNPLVPLEKQGINGIIWAVIAAESCGARVPSQRLDEIRGEIAKRQNADGSFSLRGSGDPDVTAMAIRALCGDERYASSVSTAAEALKKMQTPDGGFVSMGAENCESAAQAILALCALGENPRKNVERLLEYKNPDGGFAHIIGGRSDSMASVQALEALTEYEKAAKNPDGETIFESVGGAAVQLAQEPAEVKEEAAPTEIEAPASEQLLNEEPEKEKTEEEKAEKAAPSPEEKTAEVKEEAPPAEKAPEKGGGAKYAAIGLAAAIIIAALAVKFRKR